MTIIIKEKAEAYAKSIAQSEERKKYCKEDFIAGSEWMREKISEISKLGIINEREKMIKKALMYIQYNIPCIRDLSKDEINDILDECRKFMEE